MSRMSLGLFLVCTASEFLREAFLRHVYFILFQKIGLSLQKKAGHIVMQQADWGMGQRPVSIQPGRSVTITSGAALAGDVH